MKLFNKTNLLTTPAIVILSAMIILAGGIIAWAVTVSDTFDTADNITSTWRADVATTTGEIKIEEKSYIDPDDWYYGASTTCANTLGDGDYIIVKKVDLGATKQWKTAYTACDLPQCGIDGGQDGDNLTADDTVDFTDYPARDACKAVGGRLPTKDELNCIYTNKATFGDNFVANYYWSSTEYNTNYAWLQYFSNGSQDLKYKTNNYYVRCVRGW